MRPLSPGPPLDDLLAPYRRVTRQAPAERPWVMANMVSGLDGCAAVRGRVGELSDPIDQRLFRLLRALADVVLVGAETVRAEGYGPVRLGEPERQARVAAGRRPVPRVAVVTRSLALDRDARLFAQAHAEARPVIVTCEQAGSERRAGLSGVADLLVAGDASVDLGQALRLLREEGDEIVLCEGGPALLGQLVEAKLLDELCLTLSAVMGGDALPVSISTATSELMRFRLAHASTANEALFLRYERDERTEPDVSSLR